MPGFADCLWWVVLGGFAGWCLYWLVDVVFRRDGEAAGVRDKREIDALTARLGDLQDERDRLGIQLEDSQSGAQRLSGLLESLRDSVAEQEQKVINLEAALAAAREPQRPGSTSFSPGGLPDAAGAVDIPPADTPHTGSTATGAGKAGAVRTGSILSRLGGKAAEATDNADRPSASRLFDRLRSTLSRNPSDAKR
ncbi:MAG: hypothetical protein R3E68_17395 [Burkholderiaceae bacterium]